MMLDARPSSRLKPCLHSSCISRAHLAIIDVTPPLLQVERHTESFLQEAATLQKVNHPNVLRFYGVVVDSDAAQSVVGIITEYLPDGSLSAFLRRAPHA